MLSNVGFKMSRTSFIGGLADLLMSISLTWEFITYALSEIAAEALDKEGCS